STSRWGCQITDEGLQKISNAKCISNLTSVTLWGSTFITDKGVIQLILRATSMRHLNIGGTFITDATLVAISCCCPQLEKLVLWGCRKVSEEGLLALVNGCPKLQSINVWGLSVPLECFIHLRRLNPALRI
ncbi:hypothetical protein M569_15506, partial [Genlisea aurea]